MQAVVHDKVVFKEIFTDKRYFFKKKNLRNHTSREEKIRTLTQIFKKSIEEKIKRITTSSRLRGDLKNEELHQQLRILKLKRRKEKEPKKPITDIVVNHFTAHHCYPQNKNKNKQRLQSSHSISKRNQHRHHEEQAQNHILSLQTINHHQKKKAKKHEG